MSVSPVVSNGSGGTHKLLDISGSKPCQLATQNQQGGLTFPSGASQLPKAPWQQVIPPIATLPPESGITPGVPGAVRPPIATLPPVSGITPDMPGAVKPPIATLPPDSGITPGMPGAITPPIGTLPPVSGITPGMPGAVTPPIATLPPASGITPGMPGAVMPPIVTLPPEAGVAPGIEAAVTPPGGIAGGPAFSTAQRTVECADMQPDGRVRPTVPCPNATGTGTAAMVAATGEVVLTPGREFGGAATWNFWVDTRYNGISDRRYGLDLDARSGNISAGMDRRLDENVVAGVAISLADASSDSYGGDWRTKSRGFTVGPYIAGRLSPNWALDGSLSYGSFQNDNQIDILSGSYRAQQFSGAVNLHGLFPLGEAQLRPKLTLTYAHTRSDAYDLSGSLQGIPIAVRFSQASFNLGTIEGYTELNRTFRLASGALVMPYAEIGARYAFDRPEDGQILTGDLTLATPSPWSGTLRAGVRSLVARSTVIEAGVGYLSVGQSGLSAWEARLLASVSF